MRGADIARERRETFLREFHERDRKLNARLLRRAPLNLTTPFSAGLLSFSSEISKPLSSTIVTKQGVGRVKRAPFLVYKITFVRPSVTGLC